MQKRQKRENKSFLTRLLSLVVVVLLIATAAAVRDGKLFGYEWSKPQTSQAAAADGNDTLVVLPDGGFVVNTKPLAKDVMGYGGNVPLKISISKDGVVDSIVAEPNAETPDFFDYAKTLFDRWKGKTVDEAMAQKVDAVTGATFSSKAIIGNMNRGLAYAKRHVAARRGQRRLPQGLSLMAVGPLAASRLWSWCCSVPLCRFLQRAVVGVMCSSC